MEPRLSVLTIAAEDLPALRKFYEEVMEWKPIAGNGDIVFFRLNGFLLSLCRRKMLADFIGVDERGTGFRPVTLGYNVTTPEEVRQLYDQLKGKVKIIKEPTKPPFGGLFFYFTDIEGNIIEIANNPFVTLDAANNAIHHAPIDHL